MSAPKGTRSVIELEALARLRAQQLFGDIGDWGVYGHWHFCRPFLCFAVSKKLTSLANNKKHNSPVSFYTALDRVLSAPQSVLPYAGFCCIGLPGQVTVIFMKNGIWASLRTLIIPSEITDKVTLLYWICAELNRESLRLSGLVSENRPVSLARHVLWYDWTTATIPDRPEFNHAGWHFTWKNGWHLSIADKKKLDRLAAQMEEATKAQALDACVAAALGQIGR